MNERTVNTAIGRLTLHYTIGYVRCVLINPLEKTIICNLPYDDLTLLPIKSLPIVIDVEGLTVYGLNNNQYGEIREALIKYGKW